MKSASDLGGFARLAELHGGTIACWPEASRAHAHALLAASPEAQAILAEAAEIDAALAAGLEALELEEPPVSDAFLDRLCADAAAVLAEGGAAEQAADAIPRSAMEPLPAVAAIPAPAIVPTAAPAPAAFRRAAARRDARGAGRRTGSRLGAALRGWAAPAVAAAASAAFGLALGLSAPEAMVAAIHPDTAYDAAESAFLSADLLPAFDSYALEPAQ